MGCEPVGIIVLGVCGRRAQIDAVDRRDAVAFHDARRFRRAFRRHCFDEHPERVPPGAGSAQLETEGSAFLHRRIHPGENPPER